MFPDRNAQSAASSVQSDSSKNKPKEAIKSSLVELFLTVAEAARHFGEEELCNLDIWQKIIRRQNK